MKKPISKHELFRRWTGIRQATLNPDSPDYKWCGALGIKCRHIDDFEKFVDMVEDDIGPLPSEEHKLHRIDLYDDYKPGNLKWATASEVTKDQRKNIFITIGKKRRSLKAWCEHYGIGYWRAFRRYKKGYTGKAVFQ